MARKKTFKPLYVENIDEIIEQISALFEEDKTSAIKTLIKKLHPSDFASVLDHSSNRLQKSIISITQDSFDPESVVWMGESAKNVLLEVLGYEKLASLIETLDLEDCIEVLDDYGEYVIRSLIECFSESKKALVTQGLTYPHDTVGRIMETNFLVFAEHWTVDQSIAALKRHKMDQDPHAAIIVDKQYRPISTISLHRLFFYSGDTPISSLFNKGLKIVRAHEEINELVYFFKQYALAIVPVVNEGGKLVGSVSIENMLYIIEESTETDMMGLAGVRQDTFSTIFETTKSRFLWLFMNLVIAFISAIVISKFNNTISKVIATASIMQIVTSMGGNAGSQAMTVTVRALSKKDINKSNITRIIIKEITASCLNAMLLGGIGSLVIFVTYGDAVLSLIFAASVLLNFIVAGLFGTLILIVLDSMDLDPATASSVFLTALTDNFGFFTFLGLCYLLL